MLLHWGQAITVVAGSVQKFSPVDITAVNYYATMATVVGATLAKCVEKVLSVESTDVNS